MPVTRVRAPSSMSRGMTTGNTPVGKKSITFYSTPCKKTMASLTRITERTIETTSRCETAISNSNIYDGPNLKKA